MDTKQMVSTVRDISPSRKEITVEIPAEETSREYDLAVERFAPRVKIPGFRQGRVPRDIVRKRFAEEIERDVIDALAPEALRACFRKHTLEPVGVPVLKDIDFGPGRPMRFLAEIDIWPEIELSGYKGMKISKKTVEVGEEEVDRYLEQLRQRAVEYAPVRGRGVAEGDYVVVETQEMDLKARKKFPAEKSVLLAGPSEDNPLSDKILGLSEGEERNVEITYPPEHADKRTAGKTVSLRVKVLSLKEKIVPALDDDLAKTLGDFNDLDALKRRVRDDLLRAKEKAARSDAAGEILEALSEQVPDDLPRTLVEQEMQDLVRDFLRSPGSQGLPPGGGEALEEIKKRLRVQAERRIKNHLILKTVSERESLSVDEQEIDAEIGRLARSNRVPEDALRRKLEDEGGMDGLRESLLFRKAVDFLIDRAIM